jgi:hypothetical protein
MPTIEDYIRLKIKHIIAQNQRREMNDNNDSVTDKLKKIFNNLNKENQIDRFPEMATDLMMANIFATNFFDELNLREDEWIEEQNLFEQLSLSEIQSMDPIDISKHVRDYENKTGIFSEKVKVNE